MKILEVKNNLVKINYDTATDNLVLSGFVVIKDVLQSFIGQVIHLESSNENLAIVKLLFTFNDQGVITNYNGAIPSAQNSVEMVGSQELLALLPIQNPIFMGELAQQGIKLNLDKKMFEDKLLICCEDNTNKMILSENFISQLLSDNNKVLVFDLNGSETDNPMFQNAQLSMGKNFKLPLNYNTINFIYEKGLEDASLETKALIQDVFLEVQNYVKTTPEKFLPFETFKNVVDAQYEESNQAELLLLKNKLLKYYDEGLFAQSKDEFNSLNEHFKNQNLTVLNLADFEEKVQREVISYVYSILANSDDNFYVILNINNEISDKKLLKQIFTTKKASSVLFVDYSYKYLKELKQLSKNLILFAPIQQQNDFASYNVFLNKINSNEFIIYGQITQHMPLIIKLEKFQTEIVSQPTEEVPQNVSEDIDAENISQEDILTETEEPLSSEDLLDEEIKQDVDELYTTSKDEELTEAEVSTDEDFNVETLSDDDTLTEADLDSLEEDFSEQKNVSENTETISEFLDEDKSQENQPQQESFSDVMTNEAQAEQTPPPSAADILPEEAASTPIVPIYAAEVEPQAESDELSQGDIVSHLKYGKGVVEKMISYGNKKLCSINFDNVGRRLLDPSLAELKKI